MTALVTGASHRIGRALALELAKEGHDVAIHYHVSEGAAEDTASAARALGVRAETFRADLLDLDQVEGLIPRIGEEMGPLTVLVNNASIFEPDTIRDATRESWDRHIGSNLRAPLILIQAFAAQLLPGMRGQVINLIDQRVRKPTPQFMTYSLAKAGLWWLTRTTAQALAPAIRVNAIGPGPTLQGSRQTPGDFARQQASTLLENGASPQDIRAALSYLLRAESVTGQLICVDGGQHLAWQTPDIGLAE
ncbi:SDR family oxidoreductase [Paracoccus ravus]|uniref:SDR family oxidoreductase n=1 Tax=Paracoccus ravus TaxID=2447760 RepID=UPI00106EE9FB|nr:SDR family oxidoreductase [Paracoccus ravus]